MPIRGHLKHLILATCGWPIIDVSGKAVEETAREILNLVEMGGIS